jgi:flavin-dependent dehydrogenase
VIEGEKVSAISLSTGGVVTSKGGIFKAKFIIGADGANSTVRKELFLKRKTDTYNWQHNLGTAFETFIDRDKTREDFDHPKLFLGFVNWGYSWIFPNKDKLVVGLGGLNRANKGNFLDLWHNFLAGLKLDSGMSKIVGHPFPYGNFLLRPVRNNVVLVGDAAGFVDPLTAEGIFYAQRSAELASWAIYESVSHKKNLETSYRQLLQKYVYPELVNAKRLRWLVFSGLNPKLPHCQSYGIKILLKVLDKKLTDLVHGNRTYRWLRQTEVHELL